jgi:tetratricopeptide (TPR) repeat protein
VSIVNPDSGAQLWGRSYDRRIDDVLAIQTDIALAIAEQLRARLLPVERERIETPLTDSAAAYALYLETLVDTDRRRLPLEDDRSRLPLLDRSIELDPDFAAAYLARAEIYTWAVAYSEAGSSPAEIARQSEFAARALADAGRALEIDPTLPGAWVVRGILDLEYWRWAEAEADFARALELGPNDPEVLMQAALFETYAGRFDRALALARRRFVLDPLSVESNNGLGFIAIVAGEPQTAIERYTEVSRLAPGIWFYNTTAAIAYLQKGDRVGARNVLGIADQLRGPDDIGVFLANSALVYRWLGMDEEAERAFHGFNGWAAMNVVSEGDWAMAYLGIGDYEQARAALERAVAKADARHPDSHQALIHIVANSMRDPRLAEPAFRALRARLLPTGSLEFLQDF